VPDHRATPRTAADEASPRYAGWPVVVACFGMALFCWGFGFYGHGVYLVELQRAHGWPTALIAGASTAYYLFGAVLVAFVSEALERLGPRLFVLAGVACLAASMALVAGITRPWQLYAAYLVMSFGWAAMSLAAITNILGLWFDRRLGLAISLALNGASFGGIVVVPGLVLLVEATSFPAAMLASALVMIAVLGPLVAVFVDRPPARTAATPVDVRESPQARPAIAAEAATRSAAMRDVAFWTVSAPFALALLAQVGFLVHQFAFLEPMLGRAQAGAAVALTAIMAVVGRVGLGFVVDRHDPRGITAASLASQAAALLAMTQLRDPVLLFAACAAFGFSVGNVITLPALIIRREFVAASFGRVMALSTAVGQCTYAFGPALLGLARDWTGSYTAALALCASFDVAAAGIVLMRRRIGRA
jgi:MFS family permease